jgi:biopolymer transport protein ExbD
VISLKDRRKRREASIPLSPMIDMIFLLLVFFILSTMFMSEVHTINIKMPIAKNTTVQHNNTFSVSLKKDGSIWLQDKPTDVESLVLEAAIESKRDEKFAVVIRADKEVDYGKVIELLDKLKTSGVKRFGMAAEAGGKK